MGSYYPVFLNIKNRKCVVVGGGVVACRKVRALREHQAEVVVISPELGPDLEKMAQRHEIQTIRRPYRAGDLAGAFLVIAATGDAGINHAVSGEAGGAGIPLNVVDDPEASSFIVPSLLSRGELAIAVSTSGKSPALARKIRTYLEKQLGEEYAVLVGIIEEARADVKRQGRKISGDQWQQAIELDAMINLIKAGKAGEARDLLASNLIQQARETS